MLKLYLVLTELLGAVLATKRLVCALGEALGMKLVGDLPLCKDYKRHTEKAVGIKAGDQKEGGAEHCEIPVVDTAGGTATVLHKPCLEGTEEKNANDVANAVCKGNQCKNVFIHEFREDEVESENCAVKGKPHKSHYKGGLGRLIFRLSLYLRGMIVLLENLLAAHTFHSRREKTQDHLNEIPEPYDQGEDSLF